MCGICGFWSDDEAVIGDARALLRTMAAELEHRGPDASGTWVDQQAGVGFGHRRLSIIDLSVRGRQPMTSADGRWKITFNGEVYNFDALRPSLDVKWRSDSDTEVVVEAIAKWGVTAAVRRFVGMFAFAAFDTQARELYLVRDRLGIKPLYFGRVRGDLVFASEMSPFRRYPGFETQVDKEALAALLRFNCVPGELCMLQGFQKLLPGHVARFRAIDAEPEIEAFWDARTERADRYESFDGTPGEAVDALHEVLRTAVGDRMVADVPLGAFLSGGIDSSTVVALMQEQSDRPVRTFSIGFEQEAYNEAEDAASVARHLGTDHTELYVTEDDALDVVPKLARMYDEPFSDSSQIPTYLVSRLAREHVTVSLSGDGGDELFAGYNRHVWGPRVMRTTGFLPRRMRRAVAGAMMRVSSDRWDDVFDRLTPNLPDSLQVRLPAEKLQKLASVLPAGDGAELYRRLRSHWPDPGAVIVNGPDGTRQFHEVSPDLAQNMMFWDLQSYLPDDILTKVDRASMAVSLEARVPLIDHRVVEFAWTLPHDLKVRDKQSKWVLRQLLYRYVPRDLIERPKMGFGVPIEEWLRGPLRDWAEELIGARRLAHEGIFHPEPIRQMWDRHQAGKHNWHHQIWDILMFQAWLEAWT